MPPDEGPAPAHHGRVVARDQARRLPGHRPQGRDAEASSTEHRRRDRRGHGHGRGYGRLRRRDPGSPNSLPSCSLPLVGDVEPYDRPHGLFRAVVRTAGGRVSLGVFVSRAAAIAAIVDATAGGF